jgi:hypothetical protein
MIGFTTKCNEIVAAHARNDNNLINNHSNSFENILNEKGIYNFVSNACNEFNFIMDVVITLVVVLMFVTPFIVLLFF